jgi:hypothetical protein
MNFVDFKNGPVSSIFAGLGEGWTDGSPCLSRASRIRRDRSNVEPMNGIFVFHYRPAVNSTPMLLRDWSTMQGSTRSRELRPRMLKASHERVRDFIEFDEYANLLSRARLR